MRTSAVQVAIANGRIEGLQFERHQAFLGIPFAAPPTGPRRFCAPQPPQSWAGRPSGKRVRQLGDSRYESDAGHRRERSARRRLPVSQRLHTGRRQRKRPVFFWIHGGGFTLGSGSEPLYDGSRLATRGDIVVVTIHYRLGALGYLYLGGHGGDKWGATANAGQLDQIAALEWVRDNIAAFGGDPAQRDDCRRVGRIDGMRNAARHAGGARAVQTRHSAERRGEPDRQRRIRCEARSTRAREARHRRIGRREDSRRSGRSDTEGAARRLRRPAPASRSRRSSTVRRCR